MRRLTTIGRIGIYTAELMREIASGRLFVLIGCHKFYHGDSWLDDFNYIYDNDDPERDYCYSQAKACERMFHTYTRLILSGVRIGADNDNNN